MVSRSRAALERLNAGLPPDPGPPPWRKGSAACFESDDFKVLAKENMSSPGLVRYDQAAGHRCGVHLVADVHLRR